MRPLGRLVWTFGSVLVILVVRSAGQAVLGPLSSPSIPEYFQTSGRNPQQVGALSTPQIDCEESGSRVVLSPDSPAKSEDPPKGNSSKLLPRIEPVKTSKVPDVNSDVYHKNRIEFALAGGWLPINIPFVFDVLLGDGYTMTNLKYTLVPIVTSLRWQMNGVDGPWVLRGNWDLTASAALTVIPRGPETRYLAWMMGIRRNFVPRRGKIAPYFDGRVGLGRIDAKAPFGVLYAQGQNFAFTMNMGSGVRYNVNSRYSLSAGLNWMHISNLYLSQPAFANYGINVYGPMFGLDVRLSKPHRSK